LQSRGRAVRNDDAEVVDFTAAVDQGTNGYSGGTTVLEDVALIKNSSILCRGGSVDVAGGEQQQLANTYVVLSNGEANQLQHQHRMIINNGEDYDHDNSNQGVNNDSNGYEGSTDFVVAEVAELEINDSKRLVGNSVLDWLIGTGVLILREYTLRSTSHDGILSCPRNNTSLNHRSAMGSDYPVGTKDLYLCLDRRSVVLDPTLLIHRSVIAEEQDSNKTERIKTSLKNLEKMIDCTDDTQRVGVVATYVVTTMNAGCSKTTPKSQEKMMGNVDNALSVGTTYIVTATMGVGYDGYEDTIKKIEEQEEEASAAAEEVAMYIVTTGTDATGSNDQQDTNKQQRETPIDVEVATYIVTNNTDAGCTRNKIDNQQETREEIEEEIDVEGATYVVTTDTDSEEDSEEDTEETVDVDVDEATYIVTSGTDIECSEKETEEYKEDALTGVGDTYILTADTDVKHVESRQEEIELEDDLPGNEGAAYIVTAGSVWNVNKNNSRYGSGSKFSLRILQSRANFVNMGWTFMLELVLKIALEFGLTLGVLWQMAGVWFDWTWIYVSSQSRFSIDATDYPVGSKDLHLCMTAGVCWGKHNMAISTVMTD